MDIHNTFMLRQEYFREYLDNSKIEISICLSRRTLIKLFDKAKMCPNTPRCCCCCCCAENTNVGHTCVSTWGTWGHAWATGPWRASSWGAGCQTWVLRVPTVHRKLVRGWHWQNTGGEEHGVIKKKGVSPMQVSPGKGKLGEGVGCEVADGRVGQELHHLEKVRRWMQVLRKRESG